MDIWKQIWMVILAIGIACFAFISITVIIKGFAEVRSLLKDMIGKESDV